MAIISPIKFNPEALKSVSRQLSTQDPSASRFARSNDEVNFPVWKTPVEGKYLVYIPNHTTEDAEGNTILRADRPFLHRVIDGSRFGGLYRSPVGIVNLELGLDGSDPLSDAASECFEWYKLKLEEVSKRLGRPVTNDNEDDRQIRRRLLNSRPVDTAFRRTVFPAVFIKADSKKLTPELDADGKLVYQIAWLSMTDSQLDKLEQSMVVTGSTCPAGRVFIFDYDYDTNKPNARDAARYLNIILLPDPASQGFTPEHLAKFDEMTEAWDEAKAIEMVKDCALYSVQQLQMLVDQAMAPIRADIAAIQQSLAPTLAPVQAKAEIVAPAAAPATPAATTSTTLPTVSSPADLVDTEEAEEVSDPSIDDLLGL